MKTLLRPLAGLVLAFAVVVAFVAGPAVAANPGAFVAPLLQIVTPNACTLTQTVVPTSSTSAALLAANAARKSLRWMNTGTAVVTVAPGTAAATVGAGMNYTAAPASGGQGGSETIGDAAVMTGAFQVVSPAASSVTVWECA